jgi:hypothetical protein
LVEMVKIPARPEHPGGNGRPGFRA